MSTTLAVAMALAMSTNPILVTSSPEPRFGTTDDQEQVITRIPRPVVRLTEIETPKPIQPQAQAVEIVEMAVIDESAEAPVAVAKPKVKPIRKINHLKHRLPRPKTTQLNCIKE